MKSEVIKVKTNSNKRSSLRIPLPTGVASGINCAPISQRDSQRSRSNQTAVLRRSLVCVVGNEAKKRVGKERLEERTLATTADEENKFSRRTGDLLKCNKKFSTKFYSNLLDSSDETQRRTECSS